MPIYIHIAYYIVQGCCQLVMMSAVYTVSNAYEYLVVSTRCRVMRHGSVKYLVFKGIVCERNLFPFICAERQPPLEQLHLSAVDAGLSWVSLRVSNALLTHYK